LRIDLDPSGPVSSATIARCILEPEMRRRWTLRAPDLRL